MVETAVPHGAVRAKTLEIAKPMASMGPLAIGLANEAVRASDSHPSKTEVSTTATSTWFHLH
jgi:hypothetical protein